MKNDNENTRHAEAFGHGQQGGFSRVNRASNLNPKPYFNNLNTAKRPVDRRFSQGDIDKLKLAMPKVLEHYGVTNPNSSFSSPWREDRNPSTAFYPDTNLVHDFGTGETVDVFGLVGKVEEIGSFPNQVRRVADIVGYNLSVKNSTRSSNASELQRPKFEVPPAAGFGEVPIAQYAGFMADLMEGDEALSYLHGRGFGDEKLYQNLIGFVHDPREVSNSFTLHDPHATRGYIVIPFPTDETFCTASYCMIRPIPGDLPLKTKEVKPTGFKSMLYREWLLSRRCKVLYVTEGPLDCLALETLISKPCLGLGGTGGAKRLTSLLYYTRPELRPLKIVLALDADEAGKKLRASCSPTSRTSEYTALPCRCQTGARTPTTCS